MGHHHEHEPMIVTRQHDIVTACLLGAGLSLGAARLAATFAPLAHAWPWLIAVLAFLYGTYTERTSPESSHGEQHSPHH